MKESNNAQYSFGSCNFDILSVGPGFGKLVNNAQAPIYIFEYLDIKDLVSLAFANKTIYKMVFNSMYNTDNRFIRSLDLYLCYLKYMIDFEFDNSNNEHFLNIVYKTSSSDFKLLINCLSQESEDVQRMFGIKFELNANTGKKSPKLGPSSYFILRMYLCRVILIDLLSLSVEDFYNADGDCHTFSDFPDVIQKILDKNQKKRIGRFLEISDKKELFISKSFWDEIKKIRGEIVHDKLIKRSKNICLDGIYYWLVLGFIDKLTLDIQKSDPYLHFLTHLTQTNSVSFCLQEIRNCWCDLFGFLLTNPNMIVSICRSSFFFEKKAYPVNFAIIDDIAGTFIVHEIPIYSFITSLFSFEYGQHENSIIAIAEANDIRCEFVRNYGLNNDENYIDMWKYFLKPNLENQRLKLVMSKLENDIELLSIKKQLRGGVVVAIVSAIVFLIFLILGIVFASELMYIISMMVFLICFASTCGTFFGYDALKGIHKLESDFNNDLKPKREKLNQLNHDKIEYKKHFKQGAEFLLNSNERFLSEKENLYKPRFFEDQKYINSKQENDLLEYVAK